MNEKDEGWLTIQVKLRQESRAEENILHQGYEAFFPKLSIQPESHETIRILPMFPGYAFVKFNNNLEIRSLNSTLGMLKVISFDNKYPLLKNSLIEDISKVQEKSKYSPIKPSYLAGEKVLIMSGVLRNHIAQVISSDGRDRVEVLYKLLNNSHKVTINIKNIKKI